MIQITLFSMKLKFVANYYDLQNKPKRDLKQPLKSGLQIDHQKSMLDENIAKHQNQKIHGIVRDERKIKSPTRDRTPDKRQRRYVTEQDAIDGLLHLFRHFNKFKN